MDDERGISQEEHQDQINKYSAVRERYVAYAAVLKRVLEDACAVSFPEAFVQSRAKTVSSFAEKCVRKYHKYKNPVDQLSDLCGARIILQTLEQVRAVKEFIEDNFIVHERDDKTLSLGEETFGYRDMHYVVSIDPDGDDALTITDEERALIASLRAEIQVRTWLQHAWADTLHDRLYKSPLRPPREVRRTGNLQAALMEEGDRNFSEMADVMDGMKANYTALAGREEVEKEVAVRRLLLQNEPREEKKPGLALELVRLLSACGRYSEAVDVLQDYENVEDANQGELISDLGFAQCKAAREHPQAPQYSQGRDRLRTSLDLLRKALRPKKPLHRRFVQDLRKAKSLLARGHHRLAWAQEVTSGEKHKARRNYEKAHGLEPDNPYHLASFLGFELYLAPQWDLLVPMRETIRTAVETCEGHALAGIELPYACFTAGRLSLLLAKSFEASDDSEEASACSFQAFSFYARGLRHCLDGSHCIPSEVLQEEEDWIQRLHEREAVSAGSKWVMDLLAMPRHVGERVEGAEALQPAAPPEALQPTGPSGAGEELSRRRLIVVGGAASMSQEDVDRIRPLLRAALKNYTGVVVSGGTRSGVPGCVGDIAEELDPHRAFILKGYLPRRLPLDASLDDRYDEHEVVGDHTFSPEQLLRTWSDFLDEGIRPEDVIVLGFGGGPLSGAEYHLALALGASVAVITGTGGTADVLAQDQMWTALPNLLPTPFDIASVRALVEPPEREFEDDVLEDMARAFHEAFVAKSSGRLPENMKPWPALAETFKSANREQARYAVEILNACGFEARESSDPTPFREFTHDEIEIMAEMEHGRWNVDRLRDGWRPGPRVARLKTHDCLVPWSELTEDIKAYDREAVRRFPEILRKAGLEVYEP